tara:strand:- start:55 stop:498 length:444 start_codon:yes stop_codon:yes gene_type:complete
MNNNFYNDKYTLITKDPTGIDIPFNFDVYKGDPKSVYLDIKTYELNKDEVYSGHLIVNDKKSLSIIDLLSIEKYKLTPNNIYFTNVFHDGVDSKCNVDDSLILCSSWVLPFISNEHRTTNSLYGDMMCHRVHMEKFLKDEDKDSSLY